MNVILLIISVSIFCYGRNITQVLRVSGPSIQLLPHSKTPRFLLPILSTPKSHKSNSSPRQPQPITSAPHFPSSLPEMPEPPNLNCPATRSYSCASARCQATSRGFREHALSHSAWRRAAAISWCQRNGGAVADWECDAGNARD